MQGMESIAVVSVLMLIQYFIFSIFVGKARVQHKVDAPSTTGAPEFERLFRVHQNTLEQLIIVLPVLWLFGWYINPLIGSTCGLIFILGRGIYCSGYVKNPANRAKGFIVGVLAQAVLILGALAGPILSWLK